MPLPSIRLHGAKSCTAKSKRTGLPCNNPAAYGCKTCRMHGARKAESIKRGEQHPNYVHGRRTLEAEKQSSEQVACLQMLEDAMHLLGMTNASRSCGPKAKFYKRITILDNIKEILS